MEFYADRKQWPILLLKYNKSDWFEELFEIQDKSIKIYIYVSCVGIKYLNYQLSPGPQIELIVYVHAARISLQYALYKMKRSTKL